MKIRKTPSSTKPVGKVGYKPAVGNHWVLINKNTNKVSSSSNWLVALAAVALTKQDTVGIPALLPLGKAHHLLKSNKLALKRKRGITVRSELETERTQAKDLIPLFAVLYGDQHPPHRPPRRQEFCKWIVRALQDKSSKAYKATVARNCHENLKKPRNWRWWRDRLEKMQS